jgi:hypothetical protein
VAWNRKDSSGLSKQLVDKIFAEILNLLDNFTRLDLQLKRLPQGTIDASPTSHALANLGYSDFLSIVEELTVGWPANEVVTFLEVFTCDLLTELIVLLCLCYFVLVFFLC